MNVVVRWIGVVAVLVAVAAGADDGTNGDGNGAGHNDGYGGGYPVIEIWKAQRRMQLRQGDAVIREFKIALGRDPRFGKQYQGDLRTPEGRYYITDKKVSRFHRFLGVSYPNVEDAERGYNRGMIDAGQWADIFFANLRYEPPTSATRLGGRIGIHGYGERPYLPVDWTEGCIAVSNDDIEFLFDMTPVGTPVIINE